MGEAAAEPARVRAGSRPGHRAHPRCLRVPAAPSTLTADHAHLQHGRSRQTLGHPYRIALRTPRRQPRLTGARPMGRRDVSAPARGENLPPPRRLPHLFIPLCRSRFHSTRYRTTHFDNLRRTWKSRMYWEYAKTSDFVNPMIGARGELGYRLKGLVGSSRRVWKSLRWLPGDHPLDGKKKPPPRLASRRRFCRVIQERSGPRLAAWRATGCRTFPMVGYRPC